MKRAGIILGSTAMVVLAVMLAFGAVVGIYSLAKTIGRYQARSDANNNVRVSAIKIKNQEQRVKIARQLAEIRYVNSVGIRRSQDEIAKTLTPLYVQFEAIQAQLAMANSQNHTVIWVPAGANGVPLVSTVDLQKVAEADTTGK